LTADELRIAQTSVQDKSMFFGRCRETSRPWPGGTVFLLEEQLSQSLAVTEGVFGPVPTAPLFKVFT
jgi:hypothetical protein